MRYYGADAIVPCVPVYLSFYLGDLDSDSIVIVLTYKDGKPIGHSTSQKVTVGTFLVYPGEKADLAWKLGLTSEPAAMWDIAFTFTRSATGLGISRLEANADLEGGIFLLPAGLGSLEPGGYLPEVDYPPFYESVTEGQCFALADHTGAGHALLYVVRATPNGCMLKCEYNPSGYMVMGGIGPD